VTNPGRYPGLPQRTWAIEGAGSTGHLLDWQLVSAGERVLDVQPKLGARVRLLAAGGREQERPQRCPVGGHRGGVPKAITTARAARVLKALRPASAVAAAGTSLRTG
jgi:hypothetical protein